MTEDDYKTQQMNNAVAANKMLKAYQGEPPKMEQVVFKMTPPSDLDAIADALNDCRSGYLYIKEFKSPEERSGIGYDRCIEKCEKASVALQRLRTGKAEGG